VAIYVDYNVSAGICCFIHSRVHQKHIRECLHVVHRANGKKQSVLIGARGTKEARDILPAGRALYSWLHQPCIPAMSFALIYTCCIDFFPYKENVDTCTQGIVRYDKK